MTNGQKITHTVKLKLNIRMEGSNHRLTEIDQIIWFFQCSERTGSNDWKSHMNSYRYVFWNWNTLQGPFWILFLETFEIGYLLSCVSASWELIQRSLTVKSNLQNRRENLVVPFCLPRSHYTQFSALQAVFQKKTQVNLESACHFSFSKLSVPFLGRSNGAAKFRDRANFSSYLLCFFSS